jgi:hypothetical protein
LFSVATCFGSVATSFHGNSFAISNILKYGTMFLKNSLLNILSFGNGLLVAKPPNPPLYPFAVP